MSEIYDFLPRPEQYSKWEDWAQEIIRKLTTPGITMPIMLPIFPADRLPKPNQDGMMVFLPDAADGAYPIYSYNGQWLKLSDNTAPLINYTMRAGIGRHIVKGKPVDLMEG